MNNKSDVNNTLDVPRINTLKAVLKARKITQKKMAEDLNLTVKSLADKLKGLTPWRTDECKYVCDLLDLKFEDVFLYGYSQHHLPRLKYPNRSETP